jgi:hypothetical protein
MIGIEWCFGTHTTRRWWLFKRWEKEWHPDAKLIFERLPA